MGKQKAVRKFKVDSVENAFDQVQPEEDTVSYEQPILEPVKKETAPTSKTINQLADEVMRGVHGSGRERMLSLGTKYVAVQAEVNRRMRQR